MEDRWYGVIYYRNGTKKELGSCNYEAEAEKNATRIFDFELRNWEKSGMPEFFKPTRYEVKKM